MTAVAARPFVAVLSRVPLATVAIVDALQEVAEVRAFTSLHGDALSLLRSVAPDAIVADGPEQAESAAEYARGTGIPVLYVSLTERLLRVLDDDGWRIEAARPSSESLRNALAEAIYRRVPA